MCAAEELRPHPSVFRHALPAWAPWAQGRADLGGPALMTPLLITKNECNGDVSPTTSESGDPPSVCSICNPGNTLCPESP